MKGDEGDDRGSEISHNEATMYRREFLIHMGKVFSNIHFVPVLCQFNMGLECRSASAASLPRFTTCKVPSHPIHSASTVKMCCIHLQ